MIQEDAWWESYEKDRQENPCIFNEVIRLNEYATITIWKRKKDTDPSMNICDMAPNGGEGMALLEDAKNFAKMFKREDLFSQIEEIYQKAVES